MPNKKIKGFTLVELLVTLALTAILITICYSGLNYTEKLLKQYNEQSFFITQITELNKRMTYQSDLSSQIKSEANDRIVFNSDSASAEILFYPTYILLKKNNRTDSFLLENSGLLLSYEKLNFSELRLINKIEFDISFNKQRFHFTFNKNYDSYSKFILESKDGND